MLLKLKISTYGHIFGGHVETVVRSLDRNAVNGGHHEVTEGVSFIGHCIQINLCVVIGRSIGGRSESVPEVIDHTNGDGAACHLVDSDVVFVDLPLGYYSKIIIGHNSG